MVSNADPLSETVPKGLGGKIGKARIAVLEALCLQNTHEGCAEKQAWAHEGQNKHTVQVTKGLNADLRVSMGKAAGPSWRQISL